MQKKLKANYTTEEKLSYYQSRKNNKKLSPLKREYAIGRLLQLREGLYTIQNAPNEIYFHKKDSQQNSIPSPGYHYSLVVGKNPKNDAISVMEFTSLDDPRTRKLDRNKMRKVKNGYLLPLKKWAHGFKRPTALNGTTIFLNSKTNHPLKFSDFDYVKDLHPLAIRKVVNFKNKKKLR